MLFLLVFKGMVIVSEEGIYLCVHVPVAVPLQGLIVQVPLAPYPVLTWKELTSWPALRFSDIICCWPISVPSPTSMSSNQDTQKLLASPQLRISGVSTSLSATLLPFVIVLQYQQENNLHVLLSCDKSSELLSSKYFRSLN